MRCRDSRALNSRLRNSLTWTRPGKLRQRAVDSGIGRQGRYDSMSQHRLPSHRLPSNTRSFYGCKALVIDVFHKALLESCSQAKIKTSFRQARDNGRQYSLVSAHDREDSLEASQYPLAQGSHHRCDQLKLAWSTCSSSPRPWFFTQV